MYLSTLERENNHLCIIYRLKREKYNELTTFK